MAISAIHSFLVHPGKGNDEPPAIRGTRVKPTEGGKLVEMLDEIYAKSDTQCSIDISFNPAADGTQQNDCRDLILAYSRQRRIENGRALAKRLQEVTPIQAKLGLLFLIAGDEGPESKLVVSRFPADGGILADENAAGLSVQFLERIFMKSAHAYKAVVYRDRLSATSFWTGKAIDRQINSGTDTISAYWIRDFLVSDFRTTSVAGTRRLGDAVRNATAKARDVAIKTELVAATRLARGRQGQTISVAEFMDHFGLSEPARALIRNEFRNPGILTERFRLDADELERRVPLRTVELDNGGLMTAPTPRFDEIFARHAMEDGRQRFITEGHVVDDKLRRRP